MPVPVTRTERRSVFESFYLKMTALERIPAESEEPVRIRAGGGELSIEAWKRRAILAYLGGSDRSDGHSRVITEIVAFQLKCFSDLAVGLFEDGGAALLGDARLGAELTSEIQSAVDTAIASGLREYAQQLTSLRHDLNKTNALVRDFLGEAAFERETGTVEETEQPPVRTRKPALGVRRPATGTQPEPAKVVPEPQTSFGLSRWVAIAVVGICALLAIQFTGDPTGSPMRYDPAALEIEGILEAVAVPPDLFVRVDPTVWERLDNAGKQRLIDFVTRHDMSGGCANLLFMDSNGHPIARWSRETGLASGGVEDE